MGLYSFLEKVIPRDQQHYCVQVHAVFRNHTHAVHIGSHAVHIGFGKRAETHKEITNLARMLTRAKMRVSSQTKTRFSTPVLVLSRHNLPYTKLVLRGWK